MTNDKDFIAVIVGPYACGSFYRSPDKGKAAEGALRMFKFDFKSVLGTLKKGTPVKVNIFDVTGHDEVAVGPDGCFVDRKGNEPGTRVPLLEVITLTA